HPSLFRASSSTSRHSIRATQSDTLREPPQREATLFPYTTLFRSMNFVNLAHGAFAMAGGYVCAVLVNRVGWPFFAALPLAFVARDRKSTRLNSSHSQISYAVFFVKKKSCLQCSASGGACALMGSR